MTDNDIIKAFKDFLNEQVDGYTDIVETGGERYEFIEKELELLKETDNLINRQKAEIKKLRYNLEAVLDERADHSEAIKEFAERFIREYPETEYFVSNLLKEMERDNDE